MRKEFMVVGVILLMVGLASSLQAGGIINKQNLSADYMRTLNRNAATDMADAAVYNPAGTAMMEDGLYLKADVLYLMKHYNNNKVNVTALGPAGNYGDQGSDEPSIIPGLFAVYKQDRWSGFAAVSVPGGGGEVDYEDGNSRTAILGAAFARFFGLPQSQQIEANSYYIGYTLGGAYKLTDWLSLGGGVRYVDATQEFKGKVKYAANTLKVDLERKDQAWNYFLGLDVSPTDRLNFGFLYMSNTPLNFKSDVKKDDSPGQAVTNSIGWADGTHEREDLPGYLAFGASYFIIPGTLRIEPNLTYYLEKQANWEGQRFQDSMPGNSYDVGVTLEYILNPQWRFSVGYMHTEIKGMKSEDLLPEAPELDANTVGLGLAWSPLERLSLTLSGTRVWYESQKTGETSSRAPAGTDYDKDVWAIGLGIQYRFF